MNTRILHCSTDLENYCLCLEHGVAGFGNRGPQRDAAFRARWINTLNWQELVADEQLGSTNGAGVMVVRGEDPHPKTFPTFALPRHAQRDISLMTTTSTKTVHTARTIMFAELSKVMDHALHNDSYAGSLSDNVTNKRTKANQKKTSQLLTQLYGFDPNAPAFKCFKHLWGIAEAKDKPILALLFAIGNDYLLSESIPVVMETPIGEKVTTAKLEANIEALHPKRFSENTRRSIAQNIASSWKQAGYITGKVKNIRTQTDPGYLVVTLALLLPYIQGERGDFILASKWVKALGIHEANIRELAFEAAKRDLLQYQFAGAVTTIAFHNLFNKLDIHGI